MNVYVANDRIIDIEEGAPSIGDQILQSELAKTAVAGKKKK